MNRLKRIVESTNVLMKTVSENSQEHQKTGYPTPKGLLKHSNGDHMSLHFLIRGNHSSIDGNPLPKLKKTKGQQWTPEAKRYVSWKEYVIATLIDTARETEAWPMILRNIGLTGKPFSTKKERPMRMDLMIHWGSGQHGDPENIFGSIADALFKQDKYLAGSFDFKDGGEFVGVEVTITL